MGDFDEWTHGVALSVSEDGPDGGVQTFATEVPLLPVRGVGRGGGGRSVGCGKHDVFGSVFRVGGDVGVRLVGGHRHPHVEGGEGGGEAQASSHGMWEGAQTPSYGGRCTGTLVWSLFFVASAVLPLFYCPRHCLCCTASVALPVLYCLCCVACRCQGEHLVKFLVDGKWRLASEWPTRVNTFGETDNVLVVE